MVVKKKPKEKPIVLFCELRRPPEEIVNISSQNGAEGVVTRMLPKSHVSHVILNANVSEERFLDMKVSTENKMKKKNMDVHDHFINTFIKRLERKQQRWMKEDNYVSKNFQLMSTPRQLVETQPLGEMLLPTPPTPVVLYRPAKYPYMAVNKKAPKTADIAQAGRKPLFPRIQTVPTNQSRIATSQSVVPKPPIESPVRASWAAATNQRAETASTVTTRRSHMRKLAMQNHDSRFTDLMTWLSPVDATKERLFRARENHHRVMFGVSQSSY